MGFIQDVLRRLVNRELRNGIPVSPDEMELKSYLEREKRDNIKKQLAYYRRKEAREMFGNASLFKNDGSIIKAKNVFKK